MALNRRVNNQDVTYFLDLHRIGLLDLDPRFSGVASGLAETVRISSIRYSVGILALPYISANR